MDADRDRRTEIRSVAELGMRIRSKRREVGLTQSDLATAAGTTQRFVSELERGKATAQIQGVLRLTSSLGLKWEITDR